MQPELRCSVFCPIQEGDSVRQVVKIAVQVVGSQLLSAKSQVSLLRYMSARRRSRQGRAVVRRVQVQAHSFRSPLRASICFLHTLEHGVDKVGARGRELLAHFRSGGCLLIVALAQHLHDIPHACICGLLPLSLQVQCVIAREQGFIAGTSSGGSKRGEGPGAVKHCKWDGIRHESLGSIPRAEKPVAQT